MIRWDFFRLRRNNDRYISSQFFMSEQVKKEKKVNKEYSFVLKNRRKLLKPLWIPSISSFLQITVIFLVLYFFANIGTSRITTFRLLENISIPVVKSESTIFQNLIAINTGIGSVLIGLAFFVAQSLMDKDDPDQARVLLYKSWFFPLLASEIYIYILLLMGDLNYFIFVVVTVLGILTVISLGRTIRILIKSNDLEKAKSKVFFDILRDNFINILDNEVNRRLSNNLFYKLAEQLDFNYDGDVTIYNPFGKEKMNGYVSIMASKEGICEDINLIKLEEMIINLINYSPRKSNIKVDYQKEKEIAKHTNKHSKEPLIILRQVLNNTVNIDTPLISINKDLLDDIPYSKEKLEKEVSSIFIIKDSKDLEQEARFEISKLKERCINAIETERTSELKKVTKIYTELTREFFNFMEPYGVYTKEQAEKERTAIFQERLKPLEWMSRDIREIFEKGMKSENRDIIINVAYLPISLTKLSIEYKDHLIFQNFIQYPQDLYIIGYRRGGVEKEISEFMIDRSWRYITELSNFYLVTYYEDEKLLSWNEFKDFAQYILKVFQGLIKSSYDNSDLNNFTLFVTKMNDLFNSISSRGYTNKDDLLNLKQQSFFGVGSWIFSEISSTNNLESNPYLTECIKVLPSDIISITNLFSSLLDNDVDKNWDWMSWEFTKHKEGEVIWGGMSNKIEDFYILLALKSVENKSEKNILDIELPLSRELVSLMGENNKLEKKLKDIQLDDTFWVGILSDNALSKVDILIELLNKNKEKYKEFEKEKTRITRISSEKVKMFKENFIENTKKEFGIKNIFKKFNNFTNETNGTIPNQYQNKFGIHTFFDKAAFFSDDVDPHTTYMGFENGFDFGKGIVRGENSVIIKKLRDCISTIESNKINDFLNKIDELQSIIFISVNGASLRLFEMNGDVENYIPKWHMKFRNSDTFYENDVTGIYEFKDTKIPIYSIYSQDNDIRLIILDTKKMGEIIQYTLKDEANTFNEFYINIQEILENSKEELEILGNPSGSLKEIGSKEEKSKYLQEHVIIQIFEMFELKIDKKVIGASIEVK